MVRKFAVVALFAVASFAVADDKKDMKALNGTWTVEKAEVEGSDQTTAFSTAKLELTDGKYTSEFAGLKDEGTFTTDPTKTPKTMDITGGEGPNKGKKFPSIYELKDDTLTICYGLDEKTRPTKMETAKGSNTMLAVYKRKK